MSGDRVQEHSAEFWTDLWLRENTALPLANRRSLAAIVPILLQQINTDRQSFIGISGAPGSGKSTLARLLVHCLEKAGSRACLISLDDYYLGRRQRERLARKIHPLFRQRGVPGTHELDRLLSDLSRLREDSPGTLRLPVFDKSSDDRAPLHQWRRVDTRPGIVLVEGWCIGAPPQEAREWEQAVNETERSNDADGHWRRAVLREWRHMHESLRGYLDQLWYIHVPGWNCVIDWRWKQEQELALRNLNSRSEVANFLACFERIVNHMQGSYQEWADLSLEVDHSHQISLAGQVKRTR